LSIPVFILFIKKTITNVKTTIMQALVFFVEESGSTTTTIAVNRSYVKISNKQQPIVLETAENWAVSV
jgi:hypothetical protein